MVKFLRGGIDMAYEAIILEKSDGIATLTLNRPDKLNSLNHTILQEMVEAIDDVREDDEIKVLVITGAGRAFCSGADLTSEVYGTDPKQPGINRPFRLEPFVSFGTVMKRLRNFHKPVIAAINGVVAGGGLGMACLCDIRIASEQAKFSAIFVRRALVADCGTTYTLPRLVGIQKALELMWTGDMIDAGEAERIGLASRVVPGDKLMATVREMAVKIANGPSVAIELMKKMVYEGLEANKFSASLAYESWAQEMCLLTDDIKEATDAFLEKREPKFSGK
ncbi:MAG: enoyl-CoA hydratase [Chloroflexi bacterium]|nr:enoyl-CoA hydratase [Chloroflexota bacterium]MBM3165901.1 enoyl-CoA hydratase [Chloroflexota bacterium]MBM4452028.1 enoyl-CoA hydratase [Chloroflexota bacterium]